MQEITYTARFSVNAAFSDAVIYRRTVMVMSLIFTIFVFVAYLLQSILEYSTNFLVCSVLFAFCLVLLKAGRGFADPVLVIGFVLFIYSFMPLLAHSYSHQMFQMFGTEGASFIYSWTIIAYIAACGVAAMIVPLRQSYFKPPAVAQLVTLRTASIIGSILSILLSIYYISVNGIIVTGDSSYAEAFASRLQAGTGLLLLSVPFALGALSFAVSARNKILSYPVLFSLSAYMLLFLAHGQRKYLLIPAIIIAAFYVRIRTWIQILFWLLTLTVAIFIFSYLGFMRTQNVGIDEFATARIFGLFMNDIGANMAGAEFVILYATTSAAYVGFVKPLPMAGDYLMSWIMALPQFWVGSSFTPLNVRFAMTLTPHAAAAGQGWGFSFWGEAYLVGGIAMVIIACFLVVVFFRYIFVRGGGHMFYGFAGVGSLSSLYFALWIQRNALAYFVREFVVFQTIILFMLFYLARIILTAFPSGEKNMDQDTLQS